MKCIPSDESHIIIYVAELISLLLGVFISLSEFVHLSVYLGVVSQQQPHSPPPFPPPPPSDIIPRPVWLIPHVTSHFPGSLGKRAEAL